MKRGLLLAKAGDDYGNSFIHPSYIEKNWQLDGLRLLAHLPGGLRGWQDIVVLQRQA